jgi:hypothetical protein
MGGIEEVPIQLSRAEIEAHLIEVGRNSKITLPHTVIVVADPSPVPFYSDRSPLDNCCYAMPVGHLSRYPFPTFVLIRDNVAFYPYKYRQAARLDALARLKAISHE